MFIDHVIVYVEAGRGGNGCVSFRREKYVPLGGPNGGNGGSGGQIVLEVDPQMGTLIDLHYKNKYNAGNGGHGQGKSMTGKNGSDVVIPVPPGTVVTDVESGMVLCEMLEKGERFVAARGGAGGFGNERYKSARNRAPRKSTPGKPGERKKLELTLKLIADVGLVGEPNAGKSTLLSVLSSAHPEIAPYPFTTKSPVLGIVRTDDHRSFVMVDIPGLIEGAHEGKGMGREFLRHIERCKVIVYLVDVSSPDPRHSYRTIRDEILRYDSLILEKPSVLALTKCDLLPEGEVDSSLLELHGTAIPISSVSTMGLKALKEALQRILFP
jgi:GTP-binding protein